MMLKKLVFIALGGAAGSVLRYLIQHFTHKNYPGLFPYGTFLVNIMGCLIVGFLVSWASGNKALSETLTLMLITGFCGGFTTFSTFAHEGNLLLLQQKPAQAFLYMGLSIILGMLLAYLGFRLGKLV